MSDNKYQVTVTLLQTAFEADISQAEDVSPCFTAKRRCNLIKTVCHCSPTIHVVPEWKSACLGDTDGRLMFVDNIRVLIEPQCDSLGMRWSYSVTFLQQWR